ncbi:transmembrane protein 183 [Aplysia californica]|uniref:Transmembrane protein 183 n=1 Tax=Aplysia californica TaxID=6500 RepID=A0ABM0K1T6_APLCA|nr:transmembrane protein 183 [Aplysia californica]
MASTDEDWDYSSESEDEMPKDGRKGRKRQGLLQTSDLKLQDFADCSMPQSCSRVKKSVVSATAPAALPKASSGQKFVEKEEEELNWFEKELEDFVIDDQAQGGEEEEDVAIANKKPEGKKKKVKKEEDKTGYVYPLDFWYILSSYIDPEDIGRFSGLCKASHSVTQLAGFWRKLYHRYYAGRADPLPEFLRPSAMEKLHGLRARVIRTMFRIYPPLAARVASKGPMEDEPHDLKGHRCLLAWHQPATKGWQFCFKFQKPSLQALSSRPVSKEDVYNGYDDLFYHPDEGCSVLQVTCCHFSSVASVMGLLLNQVYVTLSSGFRYHRLRLHFDSRVNACHNAPSDVVVVLDDVLAIRVMQWWHPNYPFTS